MDDQTPARTFLDQVRRLNGADTLSNPHQTPAMRIEVYTADNQYVGEAILGTRAADEAATAVSAVTEYALAMPADYQAGRTPAPELDPLLVAQLEDHFDQVDPESYLADVFGGPDAEASLIAYEQMVTGNWTGEL